MILQIQPKFRLYLTEISGSISVSDQVAETCDACDRKEDLRAFLFYTKILWEDFYAKEINETFYYILWTIK